MASQGRSPCTSDNVGTRAHDDGGGASGGGALPGTHLTLVRLSLWSPFLVLAPRAPGAVCSVGSF